MMASRVLLLLLLPLLLLLSLLEQAHPVTALLPNSYGPSPMAKWQEKVMRQRLQNCYQDIDNGLWGEACIASVIVKENCALQCVSAPCYESIYGADPLEEGELNLRRGREFKYCVYRAERAEKLAKAQQ